jgi:hypothetical protein
MEKSFGRRRNIGLVGAAFWFIAISAVFSIWSLIAIDTHLATWILICLFIFIIFFVTIGIKIIQLTLALPMNTISRPQEDKNIWRRFAWVFGIEILAFALVNPILGATGNFELMPSINLIIVGIHFFPLARIFRVPRYYFTGLLFCIIPIVTIILVPQQFEIGHTLAWYVVPSLGCGVVATLTTMAGLLEAWRFISKTHASS